MSVSSHYKCHDYNFHYCTRVFINKTLIVNRRPVKYTFPQGDTHIVYGVANTTMQKGQTKERLNFYFIYKELN